MNICIEHSTNGELLFAAIDAAGEKYLKEATEYEPPSRRIKHTRLLIAAVIATVAVFLMGAGVLMSRDGISEWLITQQELSSGQEVNEELYEEIQSSEQYIGVSDTVNGITITLDSATFTDFRINILAKVEGYEEDFPLSGYKVNLYSDFASNTGCGVQNNGVHEDGAFYYVFDFTFTYSGDFDATELPVTLTITNPDDESEMWSFDFTLERVPSEPIDVIPEGERIAVTVRMEKTKWNVSYEELQNVEYDVITRDVTAISLSDGGMYVTYDNETAIVPDGVDKYYLDSSYNSFFDSVYVVMKDGTTIAPTSGRTTESIEGQPVITWKYTWQSAINLENVAYIRLGYTDIPVNYDYLVTEDGDVTVALESAKADEDKLYLLLKIEGESVEGMSSSMNFGNSQLFIDAADLTGIEYYTLKSDDGGCYLLLLGEYETADPDAATLDCTLTVENLHTNYFGSDDTIITGSWKYEFSVSRGIETVSLTTDAPGISELEISEFVCKFTYDFTFSDSSWAPTDVTIVTKDGEEIHTASAEIEYYREEIDDIWRIITGYRSFLWETPVSLDKVDYIYFTDGFETDGVKVEVG